MNRAAVVAKTAAVLVLTASLLVACGARKEAEQQPVEQAVQSPQQGSEPEAPDQGSSAADTRKAASPVDVRTFMSDNSLPSGDIYLQNEKLHINIAGLNPEIEQQFADHFKADTYVLHDVRFTIQELEKAQQTLVDRGLLPKYASASSIDVIHNRLDVTVPEEKQGGVPEIEKAVGTDIVNIQIDVMKEPDLVGVIVSIDEEHKRVLIQEDGSAEPNYQLSIQAVSQLADADGSEAALGDFVQGERVHIWFAGGVEESFPAQAAVRKMVPAPQ